MKKIIPLVAAIAMSATSLSANATDLFYAGVKTGNMSIDVSAYDTDTPMGILVGYPLNENYAIEFEYTDTDFDLKTAGITFDGDMQTYALYGIYRTSGDFYAKLKAGVLKEDISIGTANYSFEDDDSGLSAGIGAGYRSGPISIEAEYTIIEQDVDFLSVGLNYHFM